MRGGGCERATHATQPACTHARARACVCAQHRRRRCPRRAPQQRQSAAATHLRALLGLLERLGLAAVLGWLAEAGRREITEPVQQVCSLGCKLAHCFCPPPSRRESLSAQSCRRMDAMLAMRLLLLPSSRIPRPTHTRTHLAGHRCSRRCDGSRALLFTQQRDVQITRAEGEKYYNELDHSARRRAMYMRARNVCRCKTSKRARRACSKVKTAQGDR